MDHTALGRLRASACLFLWAVIPEGLSWFSALGTAGVWAIWPIGPAPNEVVLPIVLDSIALSSELWIELEGQSCDPLSSSMIVHTLHSARASHCKYACSGSISMAVLPLCSSPPWSLQGMLNPWNDVAVADGGFVSSADLTKSVDPACGGTKLVWLGLVHVCRLAFWSAKPWWSGSSRRSKMPVQNLL